MIEIRSNKGGVVHTIKTWKELPDVAELIESLRPKYFTEASFPMLASSEGLSCAVVVSDALEVEEEKNGEEKISGQSA